MLERKHGWRRNRFLQALVLTAFLITHIPFIAPPVAMAASVSPEVIVQTAQSGNINQAGQMLQQTTGMSMSDAMDIVQKLQGQGGMGNYLTMVKLVDGLMNGKLTAEMGKILTGIPNIGNLDMGKLISELSKSGLTAELVKMLQGSMSLAMMQETLNKAQEILKMIGMADIQGLLQSGSLQQIAQMLAQAFPQLAQLLGGIAGILGLLGGLIGGIGNDPKASGESCNCEGDIKNHHGTIRGHMTNKRKEHENWLVTEFFVKHVAPALMLMAEQLTATGMQQVEIIGAFFDSKHQLETQRLFQQLTAVAHKDYQPSEGLCTFGTSVRSLAGSERATELAQVAIAARGMQRQLNQGDTLSGASMNGLSDRNSRMKMFIDKFCSKQDNNATLDDLCENGAATPEQINKDIDYTRSIENKLTLDIDFYKAGNLSPSPDEENIFALGANLYAHEVLPYVEGNDLGPRDKDKKFDAEQYLMDLRAIAAKRSVAQNTFAAITGMKAAGTPEAQPYLYKMVAELGVPQDDLEKLLGTNPSYFAQMEILTKKALQNPVFYTELYDKPVNVDRKAATLQAIGLMQDRDIYKSLIRSESILSVLLDSMLAEEQERITLSIESLGRDDRTESAAGE